MVKAYHMSEMRLVAENLALMRGGRPVLSDLSFSVGSGRAMLLRGPNGVGKSSALMVLAGLLQPQSGTVSFIGNDQDAQPHAHLHYVGHDPAIKTGMTLAENLAFWTDVLGGGGNDGNHVLAAAGLGGLGKLDAGLLSAGQTRRLALARLLAVPRPLWLLDEPTSALDAQGAQWVGQLISRHITGGGMAVIATHLDIALSCATETLDFGRAAP